MKLWLEFDVNTKDDVGAMAKFLKKAPEFVSVTKDDNDDDDEKPKKKRGRPAKEKSDDTDEKPKKKRGRPAKEKKKEISIDDVRKALKAYAVENDKEAAKAILKSFKVKKTSELDEDDYAAVLAKLAAPSDDDDDDDDDDSFFDDDDD